MCPSPGPVSTLRNPIRPLFVERDFFLEFFDTFQAAPVLDEKLILLFFFRNLGARYMRLLRGIFARSACFVVALAMLIGNSSRVSAQPNIIHIIADDLGWTDLSTGLTNNGNGSSFYQTPNIDQLASQGMSFTSAYAMPTCVPTRMALFTGQAGARTQSYSVEGIEGNTNDSLVGAANVNKLPITTTTLAETMQAGGYTTAHIGKFHITQPAGDITAEHGFDFDFGGGTGGAPGSYFPSQQGQNWTYSNAVGPGLDAYADPYTQAYVDEHLKPYANGADVDSLVGTAKHLTDATTDAAIDFIAGQLGSSSPFYMNLAFHAVHTPIEPRPDLDAKFNQVIADNGGVSPDPRHDDAAYAALLEGMDQSIGRLVDYLQDPDGDGDPSDSIAENTLLLFYGDNGGSGQVTSSSPLRSNKGSAYEGGNRVPLIAWMPGTVAAGSSSDEPVQPIDFYPTFAELGSANLPDAQSQPLDGQSLVGLLHGSQEELQRDGVYHHYPGYANSNPGPLSSVILDAGGTRYKLFYLYENRSFEFYDLNSDIGETVNLADGDMSVLEYKLAARAVRSLREWLDETGAVYPTVRADGSAVPPPLHTPPIAFSMGPALEGLTSAQLDRLGVTMSLAAVGNGAVFDHDSVGLGIASSLETGGATQRQRVNGSLTIPEAIEFSFDEDVMLKSLSLDNLNTNGAETVVLSFVSGDNPFTSLSGYDSNGFALAADSLSFAASSASASEYVLEFGSLSQDELFITAGTILSLTADPAVGGGLVLDAVSIAQPLEAVDDILLDYNLNGSLDGEDLSVWQSTYGSSTDLRADGDADGRITGNDFLVWQRNQSSSGSSLSPLTAPVPEPATYVMVIGLLLIFAGIRAAGSE